MCLKNKFAPLHLSLVLIFFIPPEILSQKLIQDSLLLNFKTELSKTIPFPIKIDTVFDFRAVPYSRLIGIDEINKYVFVPVDLHLVTSRPFANVVREALPEAAPGAKSHLSPGIYHFDISKRGGFLHPSADGWSPSGKVITRKKSQIIKNKFQIIFNSEISNLKHRIYGFDYSDL